MNERNGIVEMGAVYETLIPELEEQLKAAKSERKRRALRRRLSLARLVLRFCKA